MPLNAIEFLSRSLTQLEPSLHYCLSLPIPVSPNANNLILISTSLSTFPQPQPPKPLIPKNVILPLPPPTRRTPSQNLVLDPPRPTHNNPTHNNKRQPPNTHTHPHIFRARPYKHNPIFPLAHLYRFPRHSQETLLSWLRGRLRYYG